MRKIQASFHSGYRNHQGNRRMGNRYFDNLLYHWLYRIILELLIYSSPKRKNQLLREWGIFYHYQWCKAQKNEEYRQ